MKKHSRWTEEELQTLSKLYQLMPAKKIAQALQRPLGSVYVKASGMGLRKYRSWTTAEIAYLKREHGKQSVVKIADKLNRKAAGVYQQIKYLEGCDVKMD